MLKKIFSKFSYSNIIDYLSSINPKFVPIILIPVFYLTYEYIILPLTFESFYNRYDPNFAADIHKLHLELSELNNLDELILDMADNGYVGLHNDALVVMEANAPELNFNHHAEMPRNRINLHDEQRAEINRDIAGLENNKNKIYTICRIVGMGAIVVASLAVSYIIDSPKPEVISY